MGNMVSKGRQPMKRAVNVGRMSLAAGLSLAFSTALAVRAGRAGRRRGRQSAGRPCRLVRRSRRQRRQPRHRRRALRHARKGQRRGPAEGGRRPERGHPRAPSRRNVPADGNADVRTAGFRHAETLHHLCGVSRREGCAQRRAEDHRLEKGKGRLWTTEVPEVKAGRWHFRQLYVGGRRAVRARTPNIDDKTPWWHIRTSTAITDPPPPENAAITASVTGPIRAYSNPERCRAGVHCKQQWEQETVGNHQRERTNLYASCAPPVAPEGLWNGMETEHPVPGIGLLP